MKRFFLTLILIFGFQLYAQDLFEQEVKGKNEVQKNFELYGSMRGVFYGGKIKGKSGSEIKSGYGETSLKIKLRTGEYGAGFSELRFRRGLEFGEYISEVNIREAYVSAYIGKFDFRIGHQIVLWGRADGKNPTDNITPKNILVRSPDEDDRREANFLIKSTYNVYPLKFELIWVPFYSASVLPVKFAELPPNVKLVEPDYPDADFKNSALALRLNIESASIDGSLSYFSGYNPFPGVAARLSSVTLPIDYFDVFQRAYKMKVLGADFSTTLGSFGLRGEAAFRNPDKDHENYSYVPFKEIQYIIGIDKEFNNFSIILQYLGTYVKDFKKIEELQMPENTIQYELEQKNRVFSSQLNKLSHSVSFRPAIVLAHETLNIELLGLYNFTTEEVFLKPKLTYDIEDALQFTIGIEYYSGPENTLFGMIDNHLNAVYTELKVSF